MDIMVVSTKLNYNMTISTLTALLTEKKYTIKYAKAF